MNMLVIRLLVAAGALGLNPAFASDDVPKSLTAKECIADGASDFSQDGTQFFFTMNFDNNCDKPIICTIDAYIVGIRGPTSAHTVMQFPAMKQIRIHKSFIVKVKAVDGTAQYGRSCNFL
jgi:hypothetical protein